VIKPQLQLREKYGIVTDYGYLLEAIHVMLSAATAAHRRLEFIVLSTDECDFSLSKLYRPKIG